MAEPNTAAFVATGAAAALLGPVLGPFALLLFAAVAGSMLAMGKAGGMTRRDGLVFILIGVAVSLSLTGAAIWMVERYTSVPGNVALMPLSFAFAAGREHLLKLIARLFAAVGRFVEALLAAFGRGADS